MTQERRHSNVTATSALNSYSMTITSTQQIQVQAQSTSINGHWCATQAALHQSELQTRPQESHLLLSTISSTVHPASQPTTYSARTCLAHKLSPCPPSLPNILQPTPWFSCPLRGNLMHLIQRSSIQLFNACSTSERFVESQPKRFSASCSPAHISSL